MSIDELKIMIMTRIGIIKEILNRAPDKKELLLKLEGKLNGYQEMLKVLEYK